ncbi:MAG: hypothetical protein RLZZ344_1551 [Pseudomonadota bacterium]
MAKRESAERSNRALVSSGYFLQTALLLAFSTVLMLAAGAYWISYQAKATLDAQERENRNALAVGLGLAVTESLALNDPGAIESRLIQALANQNIQDAVVTDRVGNILAFVKATDQGPQPIFNQQKISRLPPVGFQTYEETKDDRVYQRWQEIEAGGPIGWLRITTTDERTRKSVTTLGQKILALAALTAAAMLTAFGLILRRAYRAISTHESRLSQSNLMLSDAANRDPLTQLGNRSALNQALQTFVLRASESGAGFALCFIDLDGFKLVNDIHGHKTGDEVLRVVAQRIKSTARESDFAARLGGDEFVLLVGDIDNVSELGPVFNRLMRAVSEPIALSGLSITIGLSIGASIFPKDGATAELLLSHADEAMYRAKKSGGQQVAVW